MKKLIASAVTTALLGFGATAVTAGSAGAADCPNGPYSACVATSSVTKAPANVRVGNRVRVKFAAVTSGNIAPRGTIKVVVKKRGGGAVSTKTRAYTGGTVKVRSSRLRQRGNYIVKVRFIPAAGSIFAGSRDRDTFRVI